MPKRTAAAESSPSLPARLTAPEINRITAAIIQCAMRVHTHLGPGLLESVYHVCLVHEMRKHGLKVDSQVHQPVDYDGVRIDAGYRIDAIVEDEVIVELKAVERVHPIHQAQIYSHLRLRGSRVGLLINFNVVHLRDGITRVVNGF